VLAEAVRDGCRVEKIEIFKLNIRPCLGCGGCDNTGVCVLEDDMHRIYPMLLEPVDIILAAPVYFYALSAVAKAFIDRSQALWVRRYRLTPQPPLLQGDGYLIATGATRGKRLFECPRLTMRYFYDALNRNYAGDLLVPEVENEGAVLKKEAVMEEARALGRAIAAKKSSM
jgi:multimeric flavodoxin WrbA